jgi:threonine/homoserine/homoserine lactone efflux protein
VHVAVIRGFGASLGVILGSAVGDLLLLVPAVVAAWLIAHLVGFAQIIAVLGCVYFVILSVGAAREGVRLWHGDATAAGKERGNWSFAQGVLGNLLNPLSWSFWLATGTPTMLRIYDGAAWPGLIVFTAVWFGVAMGVEATVALAVAQTRRAVTTRTLAVFEGCAALVFLILAANLLRSEP